MLMGISGIVFKLSGFLVLVKSGPSWKVSYENVQKLLCCIFRSDVDV